MSIYSDGSAGKYLSYSGAIGADDTTFTVAFWIKTDDNTSDQMIMDYFLGSDAANHRYESMYRGAVDDVARCVQNGSGGGASTNDSSNAMTDGNWHHVVCGFSASDRYVMLDGDWANRGTSTASRTTTAPDTLHFLATDGGGSRFNGYLAEICWWNTLLSQTDAESLYTSSETGVAPETVQSANVAANWPLLTTTTVNDQTGSKHLTNNGSMTFSATHPTITGRGGGGLTKQLIGGNFGGIAA